MRLFWFLTVIIVSALIPYWGVFLVWGAYVLFFGGYELLILAVALDAYLGYALPWHVAYTLCASVLCVGRDVLKPRIAFGE